MAQAGGRLVNARIPTAEATVEPMRIGRNLDVRPLGGAPGCLAMILFSVVASILLTVLLNLLLR